MSHLYYPGQSISRYNIYGEPDLVPPGYVYDPEGDFFAPMNDHLAGEPKVKVYPSKAAVPYERDPNDRDFKGGQGVVFPASLRTGYWPYGRKGKMFAVKQVQITDSHNHERLKNEIRHLRSCDHENVIRLKEVYMIGQRDWMDIRFLVTEPWAPVSFERLIVDLLEQSMDGESSLCRWYKKKPINVAPWISIIHQCILGIRHIHYQGIVHKDIKPGNILLLEESNGVNGIKIRPIIADLGITKPQDRSSETTAIGTGRYMAPEQQPYGEGKGPGKFTSDIFSLGCSFSWIPAILLTHDWNDARKEHIGVFELNNITRDTFSGVAENIVPLLRGLRARDTSITPDLIIDEFYETMEAIIQNMLDNDPSSRIDLWRVLERVLSLSASWSRSFKTSERTYSNTDRNVASPHNQTWRQTHDTGSPAASLPTPRYLNLCIFQEPWSQLDFDRHELLNLAGIDSDDKLLQAISEKCSTAPLLKELSNGSRRIDKLASIRHLILGWKYQCTQVSWIKFKFNSKQEPIILGEDSLRDGPGDYRSIEIYREQLAHFPGYLGSFLQPNRTKSFFQTGDNFWLKRVTETSIPAHVLEALNPEMPRWGVQVVWELEIFGKRSVVTMVGIVVAVLVIGLVLFGRFLCWSFTCGSYVTRPLPNL